MYPNFSWMRGIWDKFNSTMWEKEPEISLIKHKPCQVNSSTFLWEMSRPLTKVFYKRKKNKKKSYRNSQTQPSPIFANLVLSKRVLGAARTIQGEMYKTGMFLSKQVPPPIVFNLPKKSSVWTLEVPNHPFGMNRPNLRRGSTKQPSLPCGTWLSSPNVFCLLPRQAGRGKGCLIGMSNNRLYPPPQKKNGY